MKKRLRIIRDISIPDCLPHHELIHEIKLETDSPSILDKGKRLIYDLIKRRLLIGKIIVLDIHACVPYIITRMEFQSMRHKDNLLQLDVPSVKKLRLFLLSSKEEHHIHLESFLPKHTKYLVKIYQQTIQSGRFKKASIT